MELALHGNQMIIMARTRSAYVPTGDGQWQLAEREREGERDTLTLTAAAPRLPSGGELS